MATLPSTVGLDLDLARLSLSSPYPPYPQPGAAPSPHAHHHAHHAHAGSASSSLEREPRGSTAPAHAQQAQLQPGPDGPPALQPHQIMQPPVHAGPPPHIQLKEPQRRRGVVKFFNSLKGFGFVVDNDPAALGGQEVFCHFSAISGKGGFRSLAEGEEVEYELVQGPKGFQAANLTGPGGRTVVGDPKARMQKPPTYLPLAPFAMPIGAPYLADPYHAQHAGVYAGSPYTQHVLYVPATASLPPSQYAYAPVPLAAPPASGGRGGPQPSAALAGGPASTSTFAAPQYQSYAAPPSAGGPGQAGGPGSAAGPGADRYAAMSRIGGGTGAYGAPQQPGGGAGDAARVYAAGGPLPGPGFSPPGGFVGLPGSPPLGPNATNGPPAFGGFAPFSPPSFNHVPLFGAPQGPPQDGGAFASYATTPSSGTPGVGGGASSRAAPPSAGGASSNVTTPSSALFGTTPAPIGSRSGTPAAGGRSTPALGNGSLGNDAWKTQGVLYASTGSNGAGQDGH
ncbi:hypothetical protein Rhopal_005040-T1 [Rhodotorula paludigena]|uniref:CSD domain-containing protein n=1 Tax=Rhodotorula paludigena TaxID=86838 RepID=A0AAV5GRC2_9BASI|nr:hypothetical protein Rhopal_005040-T1 [Rhodotorula paludigena]